MIEMFVAIYAIMALGLFLVGLFEGDRILSCILFGILWPVALAYLITARR